MPFDIDDRTGTIRSWEFKNTNLLFPKQRLEIGAASKVRGGAHVCCPIFGTMPKTKAYEGVSLPQHGLVRRDKCADRDLIGMSMCSEHGAHDYIFEKPWRHKVHLDAQISKDRRTIDHTIRVLNCADQEMPLSLGFHPYFATHGKEFVIVNSDFGARSCDIEPGCSNFIEQPGVGLVLLHMAHGVMEIRLLEGYDSFNIWTDSPDRYVCVEPVMKQKTLGIEEVCTAKCRLSFTPG